MRRTRSRLGRRGFLRGGLAIAGLGLLSGCGIVPPIRRPTTVGRIGFLSSTVRTASTQEFLEELRELGYVEGQNLAVEWRLAEGDPGRIPAFAAELVRLGVEVIVAQSPAAGRPAREATATIPIVMIGGDATETGLVASLAQPGGNVTGLTMSTTALTAKRLELLKEAVPAARRVAVLSDPASPGGASRLQETEGAARALRLELQVVSLGEGGELEEAFAAMARERAEALFVLPGPRINARRGHVSDLALRGQLPTMWENPLAVREGSLMAYGPSLRDINRRAAAFVDRILRGARPSDLPLEQPTAFDLVINLRTARELGLSIPQSVLQQATEIIQ